MNHPLSLFTLLPEAITTLTSEQLLRYRGLHQREIKTIIDALGLASARAQSLRMPITTFDKMMENKGHRLYILKHRVTREQFEKMDSDRHFSFKKDADYEVVVGMIKVGVKKLFVTDEMGRHVQISPMCVLDFYIHESCQRSGYGKLLFDFMLAKEQQIPSQLAYDRPSPKLLGFLKKYFQLYKYTPQANKFLIFKEYGLYSDQKWQDVSIKPHSPYKPLPALLKPETPVNTPSSNPYPIPWPMSHSNSTRTVLQDIQPAPTPTIEPIPLEPVETETREEPVDIKATANIIITPVTPTIVNSVTTPCMAAAAEPLASHSLLSTYATHYQTQFNPPFAPFYQQCQPYYPKHSFPHPRKSLKHHAVRLAPLHYSPLNI